MEGTLEEVKAVDVEKVSRRIWTDLGEHRFCERTCGKKDEH